MVALLSTLMSVSALAQSIWPKIQSDMYPYVDGLMLVRHDQSVLLGESTQQTGIFFATIKNTYSEKLQSQLLADASSKGWRLHSYYRYGTTYVVTMTQGARILDIRLSNHDTGVDAVYSVVLQQINPATAASAIKPVTLTKSDAMPKESSDAPAVTKPSIFTSNNSKGVEPVVVEYLKAPATTVSPVKSGQ
jgi:hypothetical protein